jgi:hypothetical protein
MKTTLEPHHHEISSVDEGRRRIRLAQAIFIGAATIATFALFSAAHPGVAQPAVASGSVRLLGQATGLSVPAVSGPAGLGGFADDPSDPGWSPPSDPGATAPTNPGWSSQPDPGWNADPGWDFQPSP